MELSLAGTYFYLLMVVALYTSPITIGLVVYSFFKGKVLRTLGGIAGSLPILALALQLTIHFQDEAEKREYRKTEHRLEQIFGPASAQLIDGHVVGFENINDYRFTRYQFELSRLSPMALDVLVPPTNVTSAATITLAHPLAPIEAAQLMILGDSATYGALHESPAMFLEKNYPALSTGLRSERLLLLRLSARQSQLTYYSGKSNKYPWRSQFAFLKWESFPEQ